MVELHFVAVYIYEAGRWHLVYDEVVAAPAAEVYDGADVACEPALRGVVQVFLRPEHYYRQAVFVCRGKPDGALRDDRAVHEKIVSLLLRGKKEGDCRRDSQSLRDAHLGSRLLRVDVNLVCAYVHAEG